jgi:hypothetical protein
MKTQNRRYWAVRSDKNNMNILFNELQNGKFRQGWGYDVSQDLRILQSEINKGGSWWDRLTSIQKEALPQLRMFAKSNDSIQINDILIIPNLPSYGFFCIAEVVGDYTYSFLQLDKDHDVNELGQDYGHVLPVKLLTPKGVNKYADPVDAGIRSTLRTPMRMWNIDNYREAIENLVSSAGLGIALLNASSGEARLETAWGTALFHAAEALQEKLGKELDTKFQAAEWEEPIKVIMANLYPGGNIRWVGGRNEMGADVIVEIPDYFSGSPWLIIIQVKNYTGKIGRDVLKQIKTAHSYYSKEGRILQLVVMTTADEAAKEYLESSYSLEKEIGVPIKLILKKQMMKILSEGLMKKLL